MSKFPKILDIADILPDDANFTQQNYCDDCSSKLRLKFIDLDSTISDVHMKISGFPFLECGTCHNLHLPDLSRLALLDCHKCAVESGQHHFQSVRNKRSDIFGFTDVPFIYDSDDYFYIPGLYRPFNKGFLTPVFFSREVLMKFDNSPNYRVEFASTTYGTIYWSDGYISFGINENAKVIMWLGDIAKLPESEQYYLRSENIPSDHSIGSEFYDGQIECKFTAPSAENVLFQARSKFVGAMFLKFGKKIAHLEKEILDLANTMTAPIADTDKERHHIADTLNKIYIESFDAKALKSIITMIGAKETGSGSLKRLETILEATFPASDIRRLLCPFFVLYDFRVAYSHLSSSAGTTKTIKTIEDRLDLKAGASLDEIYTAIVSQLSNSFNDMKTLLD